MFAVTVEFQLDPTRSQGFLELIKINAASSVRDEPGCRQFDVCWNPDEPNRVFLYEVYDNEDAFGAHQKMPHFAAFNSASEGMVLSKTINTWSDVTQ